MSVKRYTMDENALIGGMDMFEDDGGDYVLNADYVALLARHNALVEAAKSVLEWEYMKLVTGYHIDGDGLCRSLDALAKLVGERKND